MKDVSKTETYIHCMSNGQPFSVGLSVFKTNQKGQTRQKYSTMRRPTFIDLSQSRFDIKTLRWLTWIDVTLQNLVILIVKYNSYNVENVRKHANTVLKLLYSYIKSVIYSSDGIRVGGWGSIPRREKTFFSAPQRSDWLWGPPSLL
jgi:hypothetical protein